MGVDYDGVGGIGIEFTDELLNQVIEKGIFTREDWDDDWYECMEKLEIPYTEAGSYNYGGERTIYLFVDGNNLEDIINNESEFRKKLSDLGIVIERKDLELIEDLHVW